MANEGVLPNVTRHVRSRPATAQLDEMELGDVYTIRVESLRDLIEVYDREVDDARAHRSASDCVTIAAIGRSKRSTGSVRPWPRSWSPRSVTCTRFRSAAALCSWAGLTPKHHESDTTVRRGGVTKQGSRLVRWAVIEGTVRYHGGGKLAADYHAHRRTARQEQSDRCDRPQGPHARLLRPARRRDPMPGQDRREQLGHDSTRARNRHDPHHRRRGRRTA